MFLVQPVAYSHFSNSMNEMKRTTEVKGESIGIVK